jgi:hypothetical protein
MNGPGSALPIDVDALARVAFDAVYAEGTPYTAIEQALFRQVATAVLHALFAHLSERFTP